MNKYHKERVLDFYENFLKDKKQFFDVKSRLDGTVYIEVNTNFVLQEDGKLSKYVDINSILESLKSLKQEDSFVRFYIEEDSFICCEIEKDIVNSNNTIDEITNYLKSNYPNKIFFMKRMSVSNNYLLVKIGF